ncbi:dolichyl-phosphate beta-glucosyltransferase [Actinomycetota bacterium]
MNKKLISVIIPAYNEEKTIVGTIKETIEVLNKIRGLNYELIIVDDGSIDKTSAVVNKLRNRSVNNIKLESYFPNKGKGFALKKGALVARGDYILFMDADLEIHPDHLLTFLNLLKQSGADAVIGSKTARDSMVTVPLKRRIISSGYYFLLKLLFRLPVTDTQTGFKLFKNQALKESIQKTFIDGYSFDLELLVIMNIHNYKIIESPVKVDELRPRRINLIDSLPMLKDTFAVFKKYYFTRSYN